MSSSVCVNYSPKCTYCCTDPKPLRFSSHINIQYDASCSRTFTHNAPNSQVLMSLTEVSVRTSLDWFLACVVMHYGVTNMPSWSSFSIGIVLLHGSSQFRRNGKIDHGSFDVSNNSLTRRRLHFWLKTWWHHIDSLSVLVV